VNDHDMFIALVYAAEQDRKWMRRIRRSIRFAGLKKGVIRWFIACETLGPVLPYEP
jgi:hypothetical protein